MLIIACCLIVDLLGSQSISACVQDEAQPGKRPAKWHEVNVEYPTGVTLSPDGRLLAVTSRKQVRVWSIVEKKQVHQYGLKNHTHAPFFYSNGGGLVVADGVGNLEYTSTFCAFKLKTEHAPTLGTCTGVVHAIKYDADRKTFVAASSYGPIGAMLAAGAAVGEIFIATPIGRRKILCRSDKDRGDGNDAAKLRAAIEDAIPFYLALNADATKLAAATPSGKLRVYDIGTGKVLLSLKGSGCMRFVADDALECAGFTYDVKGNVLKKRDAKLWQVLAGNFAVSQAKSGQVAIYNLESGKRTWLSAKPFRKNARLAVSADGRFVAVAESKKVQIWRTDGKAQ